MSQPPYQPMSPHQRRRVNADSMIGLGIIIGVIAIIVCVKTARAATVCSSALVSAFVSDCSSATTVHTLSWLGIIAGAALVITGIVIKSVSH